LLELPGLSFEITEPAIWDTATHLGEVRLERQAPCKSA
jgi:hypothetical protein